MKKIVISLIWFALALPAFAQTAEFAPVGTKWWYNYSANPTPFTDVETYATLECVADTLIDGKLLKRLEYLDYGNDYIDVWEPPSTSYIYQDGAAVYQAFIRADSTVGISTRLCDFSAEVGDSYSLWTQVVDSITIVAIDSINVNGFWLKRQTTYYDGEPQAFLIGGFRSNTFVEGIGNMAFLFPLLKWSISLNNLRCFDHPVYGHYETGIAVNCDDVIIGTAGVDDTRPAFEVFAEQQTGTLNLLLRNTSAFEGQEQAFRFALFDLQGRQILTQELLPQQSRYEIDIAFLPFSIYTYTLSADNAVLQRGKTVLFGSH